MESDNTKKIMTMSFVGLAAVAWITASVLLETASATFGAVARLSDQDIFRHGIPFAIAIITFLSLQLNAKVRVYSEEIITEVKKVVWPSRPETMAMTIVVCIMLIISGVLLGVFDLFSSYIVKYLINI